MKHYVYYLKVEGEDLPFYVGKSFEGSRRLVEHLHEARKKSTAKCRKIQKAWKEGKRIIEAKVATFDTEREAHETEKALIKLHGRRDIKTGFLTNHTDGGEGEFGKVMSEASREKMSKAKMGNKINVGRKRTDNIDRFSKPVTAFDLEGNVVNHFKSSRDACLFFCIHKATLSNVLVGKMTTAYSEKYESNYHFRYGNIELSIEPIKFVGTRAERKSRIKLFMLDNGGQVIKEFSKGIEAARFLGKKDYDGSYILQAARNGSRAYKHFWKIEEVS